MGRINDFSFFQGTWRRIDFISRKESEMFHKDPVPPFSWLMEKNGYIRMVVPCGRAGAPLGLRVRDRICPGRCPVGALENGMDVYAWRCHAVRAGAPSGLDR